MEKLVTSAGQVLYEGKHYSILLDNFYPDRWALSFAIAWNRLPDVKDVVIEFEFLCFYCSISIF